MRGVAVVWSSGPADRPCAGGGDGEAGGVGGEEGVPAEGGWARGGACGGGPAPGRGRFVPDKEACWSTGGTGRLPSDPWRKTLGPPSAVRGLRRQASFETTAILTMPCTAAT